MLAEADGQAGAKGTNGDADARGVAPGGTAGGVGKHASATAWAVEGVWLWQMGGSGDRGLLKENVIRSQ